MRNRSLILIVMLFILGCSQAKMSYKHRFLEQVETLTPVPYKACMVNFIDQNWESVWKDYHFKKKREPKAQADIVELMIMLNLDQCKP
ncbi:hypothetical protein [Acinetobacter gyllenbergii]|uniref:hypothetical protein n=1 Tax=Acinetobacter gyllenbergii TaxID=134534 RepID=UPI000806A112|nr:hypothetical protein [Acinetobacter gyllenbergii]OBY74736.1 signal peptide protein [Acinetobacter gyllenbergii]